MHSIIEEGQYTDLARPYGDWECNIVQELMVCMYMFIFLFRSGYRANIDMDNTPGAGDGTCTCKYHLATVMRISTNSAGKLVEKPSYFEVGDLV